MPRVELIYFSGCPNVDRARAAIRAGGVEAFHEVNQDDLAANHPYRQYASPTILLDGKMIAGCLNDGAACSIIAWDDVTDAIKRAG
jgi:hypothetical protein